MTEKGANIQRKCIICKRCGRQLKNPESIKIGYGKVCYARYLKDGALIPLFEIERGRE